MNPLATRTFVIGLLLAGVILLGQTERGLAQKQPALGTPNPLAPTIKMPTPLGMQRGTTLDLTLTGTNLNEPVSLWTSFPAKITFPPEGNNGKDPAKLIARIEVPKDAPIGFHAIRLATTRGMSNLRIFCIDDLPQLLENNVNNTKETAQSVPIPSVVVGKCDLEKSDYFKIAVTAKQRLSFEVLGRRLGSAFDPQISLYDARTGRELPAAHNNDAPGLQTDCRLTHTFKDAGEVIIEVRDVSYRGGDDFFYRLRIGDFPCATSPMPMAVKRGSKASVQFAGPMVEGVVPVEVTMPVDPTVDTVWLTPKGANGLLGWPVALLASDFDELLETEPNNEPAKANRIPVPGGISARFQEKGDIDHFVFAAKKGQRYLLEAHAQDLYSPTEVYMVLRDAKGGVLQASNPMNAPRLDVTATADGDLTLAVEHLHYWGGPSECYRISIVPYQPGFDLSITLDRFDIKQGGTAAIPILATRRDYTGPIELSVVGLTGLSAQGIIEVGSPKQPDQPAASLTLKAEDGVLPGGHQFFIQGKATINGQVITRLASVRTPVSLGLAGLPIPPRTMFTAIGLAVIERAPFTLAIKANEPNATPGKPLGLTIMLTRIPTLTNEVTFTATGLPAGIAPEFKLIGIGQNEVKVQLMIPMDAKPGAFTLTLIGKAKHNNKDYAINAAPLNVTVKK